MKHLLFALVTIFGFGCVVEPDQIAEKPSLTRPDSLYEFASTETLIISSPSKEDLEESLQPLLDSIYDYYPSKGYEGTYSFLLLVDNSLRTIGIKSTVCDDPAICSRLIMKIREIPFKYDMIQTTSNDMHVVELWIDKKHKTVNYPENPSFFIIPN